ncbi:MAG: DUF937 domain-containing protein [Gemmatimonadetes bacterium]|nr:DUF937 domain-containing protein [Gemmatimonadota bacterium]NNK64794.1 DUF937 domain-containing protein [Gemmatimonadota bacterium]
MSDLQSLLAQLAGSRLPEVSQALGADEGQARSALSMGLPALLAALQRNASRPGGAEALTDALSRDHDGSVLDDLGSVLGGGREKDGEGILRHVLGDRRAAVEQAVGAQSGLDDSQVSKLMTMLAPLVMGQLGKARRSGGLDAGGLADLLGRETRTVAKDTPDLGGLASLLDRDGDGSIADDVGGIAKNILGGILKRNR